MQLFLIRHAQSLNNAKPEEQRVEDPALTEYGQEQAKHLAEWITRLQLTRIITSPFRRTLQTTAHICEHVDLTPEVWVDLHELGGCVAGPHPRVMKGRPGMTREQIEREFPGYRVADEIDEDGWWKSKPYETYESGQVRAGKLLKRTQQEFAESDERVAYVMHADIKVLFVEHFHSDPLECPWNTSVSKIVVTPRATELAEYNLVDHLPEDLKTY